MRHYFFLLAVFLLIFVSCGGSKTGTATDEEVADSVVARDTMSAVVRRLCVQLRSQP